MLGNRTSDHPEHLKNYLLKKNYGITIAERDAIFEAQDKKCAICKSSTTKGLGWHVDHCHKTKQVRGILCNHCNLMIGHARDNPETLISAVAYLERGIIKR